MTMDNCALFSRPSALCRWAVCFTVGLCAINPVRAAEPADNALLGHWIGTTVAQDNRPGFSEMTLDAYRCFAYLPKRAGQSMETGFYHKKGNRIELQRPDKTVLARYVIKGDTLVQVLSAEQKQGLEKAKKAGVEDAAECCVLRKAG